MKNFKKLLKSVLFLFQIFYFRPEFKIPMDKNFYPSSWLVFCYMGAACSEAVSKLPEFSILRPFLAPSDRTAHEMKKEIDLVRQSSIAAKSLRRMSDSSTSESPTSTSSSKKNSAGISTINHVVTVNSGPAATDSLAFQSMLLKKLEVFMALRDKWASAAVSDRSMDHSKRIQRIDDDIASIVDNLAEESKKSQ